MRIFISVPEFNGRVLDIGTGPSLTSVMPLSEGASEIFLTGFLENERAEIHKWLNKDPNAYDWTFWLDFAAELEGNG